MQLNPLSAKPHNDMQSLLLDRAVTRITPLELATTVTESCYSTLDQTGLYDVFPSNCHHNAAVNSLALETSENRYLLSGCADSSIKMWDLHVQDEVKANRDDYNDDSLQWRNTTKFDKFDYDNPKYAYSNIATVPRKTVHSFGVSAVQWWPFDTGMFVSASFDHTIKVWDTNQLVPVHQFDLNNRVYAIDICGQAQNLHSASALVAAASDQPFIRLLDLRSTSSAHTLLGHKGKTLSIKWHPQNPNLLASGGFDGEVKIWDIRRSNSCLCRLDMLKTSLLVVDTGNLTKASVKAHSGPVNGLVWDEFGQNLYSAGNDDKVRVWDMASSTLAPPVNKLVNFGPLTRNKYPQTIPLVLSPAIESEMQFLLFPSDNGDIFIYRTLDGKLVSRLSRKGSKNSGRTTAIVNAGPFTATYICGTMDGEILQWAPSWETPDIDDIFDPMPSQVGPEDEARRHQLAQETRRILESDPYFKSNPLSI